MKNSDSDFFPESLNYNNLDLYLVRSSIVKAINQAQVFRGMFLDIGCGKMPYREYLRRNYNIEKYIGLDIQSPIIYDQSVSPDVVWDGKNMPFHDCSFDCAMATEVLEHCPEPEATLSEAFRVVKKGGSLFFTTPFLWNLHEVPHDEYRYTPFSLERHLLNSGFVDIDIKVTGGWHMALAQMLGLWVKRSSVAKSRGVKKMVLLKIVYCCMQKLIRLGLEEEINFNKGPMITGLYGVAKKS